MSGTDGEPFAGAADAARLVQEVQNLGFDAARTIVERFVEVFARIRGNEQRSGSAARWHYGRW